MVGGLVAGTHQFRPDMQQYRRLQLTSVHIVVISRTHAGVFASLAPIAAAGKDSGTPSGRAGLLGVVAQHVVAAMAVDDDQARDATSFKRCGDVVDDGKQRPRGDADGPRKVRVLMGTRN